MAASWAILFGTSAFDESPEDKREKYWMQVSSHHLLTYTTVVTSSEETFWILTEDTLDRTAGGRVDLASVVLNALCQLYEGGVPGETAFSPG